MPPGLLTQREELQTRFSREQKPKPSAKWRKRTGKHMLDRLPEEVSSLPMRQGKADGYR